MIRLDAAITDFNKFYFDISLSIPFFTLRLSYIDTSAYTNCNHFLLRSIFHTLSVCLSVGVAVCGCVYVSGRVCPIGNRVMEMTLGIL